MKFVESLVIAIRSLFTNKLRSSLTMLGLIIGVGAVITLMSLGSGLQAYITSTFEGLGTNTVYVQPSNPDAPGAAEFSPGYAIPSLTLDDADAIADIRGVVGVAPVNENFVGLPVGNEDLASVIESDTGRKVQEAEPRLTFPPDFPISEMMVNIGLVMTGL